MSVRARARVAAACLTTIVLPWCVAPVVSSAAATTTAPRAAAAAAALPADTVIPYGHRCRTWRDDSQTREDTIDALRQISTVARVWCEIDVWQTADHRAVVFHDSTIGRVVDPATYPAGVGPNTRIEKLTWAQVSQLRTRGGSRISTLTQMTEAAAKYGVRLLVELKSPLPNREKAVEVAADAGVTVRWYSSVDPQTCRPDLALTMVPLGVRTGVKLSPGDGCGITPKQVDQWGFRFESDPAIALAANDGALAKKYRALGITIIARFAGPVQYRQLMEPLGIHRLVIEDPLDLASWR